MATKFEFKKNTIELDIAGNIFEVDPIKAQGEMEACAEQCKKWSGTMKGTLSQSAIKEVCDGMGEMLEQLLGKGAYSKIFAGSETSFFDIMDVLIYVMNEINDFSDKKWSEYGVPNRAQRRASKKK